MFGLFSDKTIQQDAVKLSGKIVVCREKYLVLQPDDFTAAIKSDFEEKSRIIPELPGHAHVVFPDLTDFQFHLRCVADTFGGRLDVMGRGRYMGLTIMEQGGDLIANVGDYAVTRAAKDAKPLYNLLVSKFGVIDGNRLTRGMR